MRKPKHVHSEVSRHGRRIYYYRVGNSPRIRLPDDYGSAEFMAAVKLAAESGTAVARDPYVRPSFDRTQKQKVGKAIEEAVKGARQRAATKGIQFDLSTDWVLEQVEAQNFKCCLTSIPFYMATESKSFRNPFAPSIDRIDPSGGYTKTNVRIVVFAINVMLMDWGQDIFERVVSGFRYTKGIKNRTSIPCKVQKVRDAAENLEYNQSTSNRLVGEAEVKSANPPKPLHES
ncbi:hypothetical protein ACVIYH_009056 [Bradyrhizobium diazoefficiens]